ncbi:MAG: tyrosine-protein kinase family protein [Spirochaetales bacterium]|nr:tyrosine-protein kinase family protein [Spirochaetales bacterium]
MTIDKKRLYVISGAFGTGKSEIAVNLALKLREEGRENVLLVDLDIVNLYHRSRDRKEYLENLGIKVISSLPGLEHADVPALSPRIQEAFDHEETTAIIDLGGSDLGGTVLSAYRNRILNGEYHHWLVVNPLRPFNETNEETREMAEKIEERSHLPYTGMIANPHLMTETTPDIILKGYKQIREITDFPFKFLAIMEEYYTEELKQVLSDENIFLLSKNIIQPWEDDPLKKQKGYNNAKD